MTEHLPECPVIALLIKGNTVAAGSCICARLRACEERVEESMDRAWEHALRLKQSEALANGLNAAREAVAAVEYRPTNPETMIRSMALDAIDALREEKP